MNKNLFRGWKDVFSFTFRQGMNEKNFKLSTIGITTLLFLVGMAICVIMAWTQKKDATEVSPIEVVHIVDESGLELLYTEGFLEANKEKYPSLSFVTEDAEVEELSKNLAAKADEGSKDVILHLGTTDKGYQMTLYLPQGSELKKDEGEDFLEQVTMIMEQSKLFASGIPMEKLVYVMSSVSVTTLDAGEAEKSIGEELVAMLFPMLCMFFIYMMNMVYGQSIGTTVSVEKTSKLMEMVLTMTKPYSLIFGKIFAMTCIAILQTVCWIGGLVAGFLIGDKVAANVVYPGYSNLLLEVFELLKGQEGSTAFTIGAFVAAFFAICLGFLFYCVLAGLFASFASKPESLSQMMGYYMITMMLGFFGGYLLPLKEIEWVNTLLRICPFTSAYMLPGDLVVGNITVLESVLYIGILLITTVVLVIVTGKIYKNQLFYKGTGLKGRFKKKNKA